ncbi:MAG: hypothetical protein JST30_15615 [Armatimonadetes bacterium]|nr:hypothetical protein [Armatimonadota bacterium]
MLLFALALKAVGVSTAVEDGNVRLYDGLGRYHRSVKTAVPLASKYLDQGFAFLYGFQYSVAEEAFREAARLDPDMAMAYWGIAASNANYINKSGVSADESREALDALAKATALRSKATAVENDLVEAALKRFDVRGPSDRTALDRAYSDAMRAVWRKHPKDADVGALFAESLMNLRPWDQWKKDGSPQPGTQEVLSTLRSVLKIDPVHPEALHLWIHAVEASPDPGQGSSEADRLMDLQPGLLHMQHMPAHIYNRTGQWKKAVEANVKSAAVFKRLFKGEGKSLDYGHGRHLLAYAAAMRGQSELALQQATQIFDGMSQEELVATQGGADYYVAMKSMFLVRFGKWDDVLALPRPGASQPFALAMWHEARGVAFAAKKDVAKAEVELAAFNEARSTTKGHGYELGVAGFVLAGEIQQAKGWTDQAVTSLRAAVKAEDDGEYREPPTWILPTRHTLGAVLLDAGRWSEAATVFEEDLRIHPDNGWALYGLVRAYKGLGKDKDSERALTAFKVAWADADIEISSSCMCLPARKGGG